MGQGGDDGSQKLARNSTVVAWVREHGENQVIRAYDIRTFYDSGTSLLESVIMHKMVSARRLCVCQRDEDKMQKSICNLLPPINSSRRESSILTAYRFLIMLSRPLHKLDL